MAADGPWTEPGPASRGGCVERCNDPAPPARGPVTFPGGSRGWLTPPVRGRLSPRAAQSPNKGATAEEVSRGFTPPALCSGIPPYRGEYRGGRGIPSREPTGLPLSGGERLDARGEPARAPPLSLSPQPSSPPVRRPRYVWGPD